MQVYYSSASKPRDPMEPMRSTVPVLGDAVVESGVKLWKVSAWIEELLCLKRKEAKKYSSGAA